MTKEQIEEYIAENSPTTINRCAISRRWETRIWQLETGEIVETSNYSAPPESPQAYESITGRDYEFIAN